MIKKPLLSLLVLVHAFLLLPTMASAEDLPRLYVDSNPKNARVIIWNIQPSFRQGMTLLPGDYDIQVQHPGYQAYRETIHIEKSQRLKVTLQPKLYPLNLSLGDIPLSNAKITIWNIKPKFKQGMHLPSGEYKLQVEVKGYQVYSETIRINGKPLNWKVNMVPSPVYSASSVDADAGEAGYPLFITPKDAKVRILNIKPKFKQGIRLLPGKYHLEIKYKNFDTITPWIEIKDGTVYIELLTQVGDGVKIANSAGSSAMVEDVEAVDNAASDVPAGHYRLNVTTVPEDATVHIFNTQQVYTAGMALKPGRYLLHISAPNVPMHKKWVEIVDQDVDVHMEL